MEYTAVIRTLGKAGVHCAREVDTKRLFRYTLFLKVDTHDIFTSSCFTKVDIFQGFLFQKLTRPCKYPYYQRVASSFGQT